MKKLKRPQTNNLVQELTKRNWTDTNHPMVISVLYSGFTYLVEKVYNPEFGSNGYMYGYYVYNVGTLRDLSKIKIKSKQLLFKSPKIGEVLKFLDDNEINLCN